MKIIWKFLGARKCDIREINYAKNLGWNNGLIKSNFRGNISHDKKKLVNISYVFCVNCDNIHAQVRRVLDHRCENLNLNQSAAVHNDEPEVIIIPAVSRRYVYKYAHSVAIVLLNRRRTISPHTRNFYGIIEHSRKRQGIMNIPDVTAN